MGDKREYLSEAHKIREAVREKRFWSFVAYALVGVFLGVFLVWKATPLLYDEGDALKLRKIEERFKRGVDPLTAKRLREVKEEIQKRYPPPLSPLVVPLADYGGNRVLALLLSLAPLGVFALAGAWLLAEEKKLRRFFFPVALKEQALSLKKVPDRLFFYDRKGYYGKILEEVFTDVRNFIRALDSAVVSKSFPEEDLRKEIRKVLKEVLSHAKTFYPPAFSKRLELFAEVILWHYAVSLYGNAPAGLLSLYVRDPVLKKMLSLYRRRHLPLFYDGKTVDEENREVHVFLRILYECEKKSRAFSRLDAFDPLRGKVEF